MARICKCQWLFLLPVVVLYKMLGSERDLGMKGVYLTLRVPTVVPYVIFEAILQEHVS